MADMDIAQRGDVGESIVYIILKNLGFNVDSPTKNSDDRGYDYKVDYPSPDEVGFQMFHIQVKTVNKNLIEKLDTCIKYDLKVENNNKLFELNNKATNQFIKGLLIVVIVPDEINTLLNISINEFLLRCQIFWTNTFQKTTNSSTVRINIPIENQIIIDETTNLQALIEKWRN